MTDGRTDRQTDGQTDGGDCNIPDAFLKKRWDTNRLHVQKYESRKELMCSVNRHLQEMSHDVFWSWVEQ